MNSGDVLTFMSKKQSSLDVTGKLSFYIADECNSKCKIDCDDAIHLISRNLLKKREERNELSKVNSSADNNKSVNIISNQNTYSTLENSRFYPDNSPITSSKISNQNRSKLKENSKQFEQFKKNSNFNFDDSNFDFNPNQSKTDLKKPVNNQKPLNDSSSDDSDRENHLKRGIKSKNL